MSLFCTSITNRKLPNGEYTLRIDQAIESLGNTYNRANETLPTSVCDYVGRTCEALVTSGCFAALAAGAVVEGTARAAVCLSVASLEGLERCCRPHKNRRNMMRECIEASGRAFLSGLGSAFVSTKAACQIVLLGSGYLE